MRVQRELSEGLTQGKDMVKIVAELVEGKLKQQGAVQEAEKTVSYGLGKGNAKLRAKNCF